jgi:dTDP-4-amino-4,6-dideoxygalactose transaminase
MAEGLNTSTKIQMVDLLSQHQAYQIELDTAVQNVLSHCAFINGPEVKYFAQNLAQYLDIKHVIPCANGTDALQIALMSLGLQKGDEVITTSFNYVSAAEAAALLGLKPVFVEIEKDTFNLDVSKLEKVITPKTKAIVAVHLFGQACDMEQIMLIAKKYNLYVIEDNAQSLGSEILFNGSKRKAGTIGHLGTTSFFPTKNLGGLGDGGAIFTCDDALSDKCRSIASHGQGIRYEFKQVGVNSRLDTLQAAILNIKLRHLEDSLQKRGHWACRYFELLHGMPEITLPHTTAHSSHTYNQFTLQLNGIDRDALKQHLSEVGIPAMIYYPRPLHLQPAFANLGYVEGDFPVSEKACKNVISLPIHPTLQEEQVQYIAHAIQTFCAK